MKINKFGRLATFSAFFCFSPVDSFVVPSGNRASSTQLFLLDGFFTGGILDKQEDEAVKIASKIRSVSDLGWTGQAKRRGNARPRHRAYGGTNELPVQLKANYDESNPRCCEKWLTLEDFYSKVKTDGPAADTVFVALAGGVSCAEREICESLLEQWCDPKTKKLNEAAFLASVKKGRVDLAAGWALYLAVTGGAASCIVFPTSPLTKAFERFVGSIQASI